MDNFVDPHINGHDKTALVYLNEWLLKEYSPILVIKGTGGIGKTTVAKKFSNFVYENLPNTIVIFIDSIEIIKHLIKYSEYLDHSLELYDIYRAYIEVINPSTQSDNALDQDLLKANLDNGNVIFIIDGLDEVIMKLDKLFDLNNFLSSISENYNEIGNSKVILTCRNYFWDKSNPKINIDSIELLPFDKVLATRFFENRFENLEKAVKKGMQISNNLMKGNSEAGYIPYVLDIVAFIIKDEVDGSILDDPSFHSELLDMTIRNDYILYRICHREIEKLGNTLSVDLQVQFFISFAIKNKSIIKANNFASLFQNVSSENISQEVIESMKAHPVLFYQDETIAFRYDFLEEHFKNILIGEILRQKQQINLHVIEILSTFIRYNSSFVDDCCTRLGKLEEKTKLILMQLIEDINNYDYKHIKQKYIKEKAVSSIFIIALKSLKYDGNFNINGTTNLMKDFFYSENIIKNMAIYDLNILNGDKIIFDFTGLHFIDCHFSGYEHFFECRFDKSTHFENCTFSYLHLKKGINTTALPSNFCFSSCKMDESTENVLKRSSENYNDIKQNILTDLKLFLKIYYIRGNLQSKPLSLLKSKYKRRVVKFDDMLKKLNDISLIRIYDSFEGGGEKRVEIYDNHKVNVLKFILEGTMSNIIKETLQNLLKED